MIASVSVEPRQGGVQEGELGVDSEATDDSLRFYEKHKKYITVARIYIIMHDTRYQKLRS